MLLCYYCTYYVIYVISFVSFLKGTVARELFCFNCYWGYRLGPIDGPQQLLTFIHCPFNLLQYFKDGVQRSKTILSSSQKGTRVTVFVFEKYAYYCLRKCV